MNGAGVIEAIEEKDVLGKLHKYYVLKIPAGNLKLMLPVDTAQEIGVRRIVSEDEANKVLSYFKGIDKYESESWNLRYRENVEKLKKGKLSDVAYVAKTLFLRDKARPLSSAEMKMFVQAKNILLSELALAKNCTYDDLEKEMF
jgi:CarD family transcriptional regulator